MAKKPAISKTVLKRIGAVVDSLYSALKKQLLGSGTLSLKGLFTASTREEGVHEVNEELMNGLVNISEAYVDAAREKTKAQILQEVQSHIQDAANGSDLNLKIADILEKSKAEVQKIVETETTIVRNSGIDDAVRRLSALKNIGDPSVFFVIVRDGKVCDECKRLHLSDDGVTPRVWKRSDVSAKYHKRGDPTPKLGGLHPHCRCLMSVLMPGYGFDDSGKVTWVGRDYLHPTE